MVLMYTYFVGPAVIVHGLPSSASWQDLKVHRTSKTKIKFWALLVLLLFLPIGKFFSGSHAKSWWCVFCRNFTGQWRYDLRIRINKHLHFIVYLVPLLLPLFLLFLSFSFQLMFTCWILPCSNTIWKCCSLMFLSSYMGQTCMDVLDVPTGWCLEL